MPIGLIALALGAFGIGLTEFVIMGLLPEVATDFAVDEPTAGWLITGYALAVVAGALVVTALTIRMPRKPVLLGLVVLFILGNLLTALSEDYSLAMVGRIVAALAHGAYFGIGTVVAAALVAPEKKARAIAIIFTGLTAANVLGVPFGTFIGQQFGWRATFWAISGIGVLALIGIATLVPRIAQTDSDVSLRGEARAFRSVQVWLSLLVTVLASGAMFGAFTYIAYVFIDVGGFTEGAVPWLLVLFGVGLVIGNWAGGRFADRALDGTLLVIITALIVVLIGFALLASSQIATVIAVFFMGGFGFASAPGLQSRIMKLAGSAPTLASSANIGAFNVGNAVGSWLGGVTIAAGLGYTSPFWAGALMAALSVLVLLLSRMLPGSTGSVAAGRRNRANVALPR